jgi:hypothetical protein
MQPWQLWQRGELLTDVGNITPQLASWDAATHPAQRRLQAYLREMELAVGPLPAAGLFLDLRVDVGQQQHLLHHHDLENYLTPLVIRLGPARFRTVWAMKQVGGGSRLRIGYAQPQTSRSREAAWASFSYRAGSGVQSARWKQQLRAALAAQQPPVLPTGPVEVRLAWRCSPQRNWVTLWKPSGDAMGPVLGEDDRRNPYNPRDDRIVRLELHVNIDASMGHDVVVGMWWRAHERSR